LAHDRSGNVLMIMGLAVLPLTFAVGMGIDYSRAEKLQTKLNAAADAAVLAAVDASMMQQADATAQAAAKAMFEAQIAGLNGLIYTSATGFHMTYQAAGALNNGRTITVTYTAASKNIFASLLGAASLPLSGTATANAASAPYINFYLVLDVTPSMLLPSTSIGLAAISAATSTTYMPSGCDFACHEQTPHNDNLYVRNASGQDIWLDSSGKWHAVVKVYSNGDVCTASCGTSETGSSVISGNTGNLSSGQYADGTWLTQNYTTLWGGSAIDLRLNDETLAAQQLIPFATATAAHNNITYNMQMFAFGYGQLVNLSGNMANVNTLSSASVPNLIAQQPLWYENNCFTQSNCNNDEVSDFTSMLNSTNSTMPNPGTGQTASSPQEVMFIVTDGMDDENLNGTRNDRELQASHIAQCQAIKNRGIKIAILYTQYLPAALQGYAWSLTNVAPYIPNVQPALVQCASTGYDGTPLVYTVTTDQNIPTALQALFSLTVHSAHLVK
jgi:Flp pilus assembly protein TadG